METITTPEAMLSEIDLAMHCTADLAWLVETLTFDAIWDDWEAMAEAHREWRFEMSMLPEQDRIGFCEWLDLSEADNAEWDDAAEQAEHEAYYAQLLDSDEPF